MPNTLQIETSRNVDANYFPSPRLWASCPWQDILEGKASDNRGFAFDYRFNNFPGGVDGAEASAGEYWRVFRSTGATVAIFDDDGGGATFGSDGDNEGAGLRLNGAPFQIDLGMGAFWMEWCFRTSTVADTKHGFAFGLQSATEITATSPITAAGAMADVNQIVIRRDEADGDQLDTAYKADGVTAVTVKADCLTGLIHGGGTLPSALVADTVTRGGFRYTPTGHKKGDHYFSYWINGIELPDGKVIPSADGTDFPNDVRLTPFFALINATATTPGTTTLLWMRAAQLSVN